MNNQKNSVNPPKDKSSKSQIDAMFRHQSNIKEKTWQ